MEVVETPSRVNTMNEGFRCSSGGSRENYQGVKIGGTMTRGKETQAVIVLVVMGVVLIELLFVWRCLLARSKSWNCQENLLVHRKGPDFLLWSLCLEFPFVRLPLSVSGYWPRL